MYHSNVVRSSISHIFLLPAIIHVLSKCCCLLSSAGSFNVNGKLLPCCTKKKEAGKRNSKKEPKSTDVFQDQSSIFLEAPSFSLNVEVLSRSHLPITCALEEGIGISFVASRKKRATTPLPRHAYKCGGSLQIALLDWRTILLSRPRLCR